MVPLVALIVSPSSINRQEAVAVAWKFAVDMGVPEVGALRTATENAPGAWGHWGRSSKTWDVVFDRPAKGWIAVNLDGSGTVFRVCRSDYAQVAHCQVPREFELGQRLLPKIPHAIPVRALPNDPDTLHAVVSGLSYFNLNPTYGYRFSFDPQGKLTYFDREDDLPPTNANVPTVDRTLAKSHLEDAWAATNPNDWPFPRHIKTELGYYVFVGEQARLVWRGEIVTVINGKESSMGYLKVAVDATTGEVMEAGDQ